MAAKWTVAPSHEELAFLVEAGIIYRDAKNFQGARDVFTGVKELFPQYDFPEVFLGTVDFQEGHFEAAEAHYRKALEMNPRSAFAYAHLGEASLFRKDKETALKHLKDGPQARPARRFR